MKKKYKLSFLQFDIENFYPSISEELLEKALNYASQFVDISPEDRKIILQSRKSTLYSKGEAWTKKGDSEFDVTMGSFDGAEICELVGLYLLSLLQDLGMDVGLYRDDGMAVSKKTPFQMEKLKKKIQKVFKDNGLNIVISVNLQSVDFLDVTLDLKLGTYKPFVKPNNTPLYINAKSNHPPSILKNIPLAVNKRLSEISSNEEIFNNAAPMYQKALKDSGHNFNLKFNKEDTFKPNGGKKKRKKKRNIIWFNPPFSTNVNYRVGEKFLKLVEKCFPKGSSLYKLFNKNNMKISYKTCANMKQQISGHNSKVIKQHDTNKEEPLKTCNCQKKSDCPLDNKCLHTDGVVYQATITQEDGKTHTYLGVTNDFKSRHRNHKKSFKSEKYSTETELGSFVFKLESEKVNFTISWKVIDKGKIFSPVNKICSICTKEKYYLIHKPELGTLNEREELGTHCRHGKAFLLSNLK